MQGKQGHMAFAIVTRFLKKLVPIFDYVAVQKTDCLEKMVVMVDVNDALQSELHIDAICKVYMLCPDMVMWKNTIAWREQRLASVQLQMTLHDIYQCVSIDMGLLTSSKIFR